MLTPRFSISFGVDYKKQLLALSPRLFLFSCYLFYYILDKQWKFCWYRKNRVTQEYRQYTTGDYTINHANYINLSNQKLQLCYCISFSFVETFPNFLKFLFFNLTVMRAQTTWICWYCLVTVALGSRTICRQNFTRPMDQD